MPNIKLIELANITDLDEAAHNELPHLDLHCLPASIFFFFLILNIIYLICNSFIFNSIFFLFNFFNFAVAIFVVSVF